LPFLKLASYATLAAMTQMTTRSGRPASQFCFGTMQFGSNADDPAARAMYEACRAAGINFFDTAYVYNEGRSEQMLGSYAISEREDVILATKAEFTKPSTAENISKSLHISLERMKTDYIDLFYLHRFDEDTPLEDSLAALADLKRQGLFRYTGVSNFAAWQVMKAQAIGAGLDLKIDALQPMYNLVKRQAEVEILPACLDQGVAVYPYSPLGGGLLTGKYAGGAGGRLNDVEMYAKRYDVDWMRQTAAALPALAAEYGTTAPTLAVAWVAHHQGVTGPIISARSAQQLQPSLDALSFEMSDEIYAAVSKLSQAPAPATDRLEEA
jgi:aryl-alcohol dehydrogenase-like predicted oxidoreductase